MLPFFLLTCQYQTIILLARFILHFAPDKQKKISCAVIRHLPLAKNVVVDLADYRWLFISSVVTYRFRCSGHNRFLILDEKWPSVRDTASTTSWTHPPTVSSWRLGPGKNASCLSPALLLSCVRNPSIFKQHCHFDSLSNF